MIVSEYLSDIFVGLSEGCFLLQKESYICLEVTSQKGKEPQFSFSNVRCVRDGSYTTL